MINGNESSMFDLWDEKCLYDNSVWENERASLKWILEWNCVTDNNLFSMLYIRSRKEKKNNQKGREEGIKTVLQLAKRVLNEVAECSTAIFTLYFLLLP